MKSTRRGFTLVELLAVIMIIAMLAALITPAVMQAMSTARDAAIKSEIEMLHMAFMKYKAEYGELPPSDLSDTANVRRHLLRLFPRISPTEIANALTQWSTLSPAQALVLWLTGYYDNPQFPLTNGGITGGSRTKLYDFNQSRLYGVSAANGPTAQNGYKTWTQAIGARSSAIDVPVYVGPNCKGLPYVYFSAPYIARQPAGSNNTFLPAYQVSTTTGGGDASGIAPYVSSIQPLGSSSLYEFCNGDTFQIIAPGRDGSYGNAITTVDGSLPQIVGVAGFVSPLTMANRQAILQKAGYPFGSDLPAGHLDNVTNFAPTTLKAASEKALK
jgi:prepilin-type N-terminal cleavage/methylation domain-containing protein